MLRQLIVNARSLSKVAFTFLALFRGLAVSPCASFERHTLYHCRVIKQVDILRAVFRSRPDLRCIEGHRRDHSPSSPKFLPDVRRFCRDPSAHRRFVDERLSIRPGQGGADSSGLFVFGRLPEKPAHIGIAAKSFQGRVAPPRTANYFLGRIAPSRTAIVDM